MSQNLQVWYGSGSPFAWRVLLALEEKKLKYDAHLLSFSNKETKTEEYLKLNPRGKVPTLKDGDVVIYEAGAILQYLEAVYPEVPLIPKEKKALAEAQMRLHETSYFDAMGEQIYPLLKDSSEEKVKAFGEKLDEELVRWEKYLNGHKFVVGDSVTLADVALFPALALLKRWGYQFTKYPNLLAWFNHFSERESSKTTQPPHWKESAPPGTPLAIL